MYFSVFFYNLDQTLPSPCEKKELVSKKLEMVEKAGSSSNRGNFSIILGKTNSIAFWNDSYAILLRKLPMESDKFVNEIGVMAYHRYLLPEDYMMPLFAHK